MPVELKVLIIFASLLFIFFLGLPVAFSLIAVSLFYLIIFAGFPAATMAFLDILKVGITDIYIAIPLFVFMAAILSTSGISTKIYGAMFKWSGKVPGALEIGTVMACTVIAAMTGLAATGIVAGGIFAYPEMKARQYEKKLALGTIVAAGCLGPIIPPSLLMIIIGQFAQVSVGQLFIGGIVPGLILAVLFCAWILFKVIRNPKLAPPSEKAIPFKEKLISVKDLLLPGIVIVMVLGSIYAGICMATEAAAVGCVILLLISITNRTMTWKNLKESLYMTGKTTVMVLWLAIGGILFASLLARVGGIQWLQQTFLGLPFHPIIIIILMQLVGLILGMFMDAVAISIITIPVFAPIVIALDYNLLLFCILYTINMVAGFMSPPFGLGVFYLKGTIGEEATVGEIFSGVIPFFFIMILVIAIGIALPQLYLWLPGLIMK